MHGHQQVKHVLRMWGEARFQRKQAQGLCKRHCQSPYQISARSTPEAGRLREGKSRLHGNDSMTHLDSKDRLDS